MDFLRELIAQPEFKYFLGFVALYIADAIATATPNPFDNMLVRAFKAYQKKKAG